MDDTKKGLTGNQLKGIALCSMTLDHIICVLFPQYPTDWWILLCQTLGRIAAPIFWYMVAEGYRHTHDLRRYLARLFIFAVIGHFAYNFAFGIPFVPFRTSVFNQTSVIWPLFIGVVALWACDREQLAALCRLGIPQVLQQFLITGSITFINSRVNVFGVTASAVDSVGGKLNTVVNVVILLLVNFISKKTTETSLL